MASRPHQKRAKAKRKLPFDPTPQKQQFAAMDKENAHNSAVKPSGQIEESFMLNFSTFIDQKRGATLDVTVSPTSFDLSDMPASSSEDDNMDDETPAVGGITATTFVLEDKMRKEPDTTRLRGLAAKKDAAEQQRRDAERQRMDVEEEVRRLRENLINRNCPSPQLEKEPERDVVSEAIPAIVERAVNDGQKPQLLRFATSPNLKAKGGASNNADKFRSALSTTDLYDKVQRAPLNEQAKKARLQGLHNMGNDAASEQTKTSSSAMDPAARRARTKSRPQKIKMLKAISRLETVDLKFETVEAQLIMQSPSVKVGQAKARDMMTEMVWPGDAPPAADGSLGERFHAPQVSSSEASESAEKDEEEEESESMDEEMAMDVTLEQSMVLADEPAGSRYSIFVPAGQQLLPPSEVKMTAADLMDVSNTKMAKQQSLEQLDYVTKEPKLAGLFGEHLKGRRADALLRILDDIQELKQLGTDQERLSLSRSIFQMYLSDSTARENTISVEIVDAELRASVKKQVRAARCSADVFAPVEEAIRSHLADEEIPTFVRGDLYRTLGFKKQARGRPKKASVQDAFAAPVPQTCALFKKVEESAEEIAAAAAAEETVAFRPKITEIEDDEDEDDDLEEESSDASPVQATRPVSAAKTDSVASLNMIDTTLDSILHDAEERETFLSFVGTTDDKSAQKTESNVAFLLKVAQFNSAVEAERPKVARSIYNSFLATPEKQAMRRDQKGQVDVDVSELRKRQLVSRYRNVIERPADSPAKHLKKGFFDKAARDVQAFVEPALNKYNAAKKEGSLVLKKPARPVRTAAAVVHQTSCVVVPANLTLADAVEHHGSVVEAFAQFASEIGRPNGAQYLDQIFRFRQEGDAARRTDAASVILKTFVARDGPQSLEVPDHVRSGPEMRWGIFSKRNLIKTDFFDSLTEEVIRSLEKDTWPRFKAHTAPVAKQSLSSDVSSILSESSGVERLAKHDDDNAMMDESKFDFGMTLQRGEIEEEIRRRLREEQPEDDSSDSDSGVEDSPDAPTPGTVSHRGLDLSPSTAADLLSRLEGEDHDLNDTVMLPSKKASVPSAQSVFFFDDASEKVSELDIRPSTRPQSFIPVQRASSEESVAVSRAAAFRERMQSGVWPSRAEKMTYAEGLEGKKRQRFVVLKNKTLYVWSSEADYKKSKEPKRTLDMDNLIRMNIVRDHSNGAALVGSNRWTLRINFDGLDFAVVLGADTQQVLIDWKNDLANSAPHVTV